MTAVQKRWPQYSAAMGGFCGNQRGAPAGSLSRPSLHLQRRHPGNRRGDHGDAAGGGERNGHSAVAADDRDVWRRVGRHRHHRPADCRDEGRGPERGAGARAASMRSIATGCWWKARAASRRVSGRLVRKRADIAGWKLTGAEDVSLLDVVRNARVTVLAGCFGTGRRLYRRDCARDGAAYGEAHHLSVVESDIAGRGYAGRPVALDGWPRSGGYGQPVSAGRDRRQAGAHFAGEQFVHLSGACARDSCRDARRVTDGMIMAAAQGACRIVALAHG